MITVQQRLCQDCVDYKPIPTPFSVMAESRANKILPQSRPAVRARSAWVRGCAAEGFIGTF